MKRFSALVRPLALLGVTLLGACAEPAAPGAPGAVASSISGSSSATTPGKLPRYILPSNYHESGAREAPGSRPKVTTDHTVFGPLDKLVYFGGRVISNVNVIGIDWIDTSDATNTVNPTLAATLPDFFATITTSPYFTWLAEYNTVGFTPGSNQTIGYGTFDTTSPPLGTGPGGTYLITPTVNTTRTLANGDISAELSYQIEVGNLPQPTAGPMNDVNNLYVFDFPPNFTITLEGMTSCKDYCGYHYTLAYGPESLSVPYAVLIDVTSLGCGGCEFGSKDAVQNATFVHAHELVEAITDTEVGVGQLSWYDETDVPGGEIADLCYTLPGALVSSYYVTNLWSNANGSCLTVAPVCTPTTPAPPSCTPCTTTGTTCAGTTPYCETDTSSPNYGICLGCTSDADCSGSTAICDPTTNTCRGCIKSDCTAPTAVCGSSGFDNGKCVQCDSTDKTACTGATPTCDTLNFVCVGCLENSDCSGSTPICDDTTETCRACGSDADCSPGVCAPSGACVGCLKSSDCGSETCDTTTNTCQCDGDSQCKNPTPVCGSGKTCVACKSAGDCAGNSAGDVCSGGSCVQCATSADCKAPTPVCDTKTKTCHGGGVDDGGPPPAEGGTKKPDAGAGDGGTGSNSGSTGGCATAPSGAGTGAGGVPWLVLAGLALMRARRRSSRPSVS
jgi:MYXO-CTERM domain-containing protein